MREIKFRAWDIVDEVMREVLKIDFDLKVVWLLKYINGEKRAYELEFKDIELMQLTGLHDKNGKEIYEGDIVKLFIPVGKIYICIISWDKFNTGFMCNSIKNDLFLVASGELIRNGEVIGNIYENPELLKEVKE